MGIGMLLGLVESIGDVIGNLFSWFGQKILTPALEIVVSITIIATKYVLSGFLWSIGCFLLQIIDFLQMLFRALAGLESEFITVGIDGSSGNGDLIVQIIRSEVVVQAFFSCCIVGIFLLMITTIFQMIKTEYTTEGAQNSKTSILGKSLKSFSNLLLVPLLVIFGVIIGNSVLNLIDTATGGGSETKISGTLWVAAGSDALWKEDGPTSATRAIVGAMTFGNGSGTMPIVALGLAIAETAMDKSVFTYDMLQDDAAGAKEYRAKVETNFSKCERGYRYSNIGELFDYYNIFEVNYFVLIFAACMVLKTLFLVCFGLVDRTYQCIVLFVISPIVIGMSPTMDKVGSWRSQLIQRVMSTYGTVIGMNLFFIILQVFMNLNVTINNDLNTSPIGFRASFLTGIVKIIFIIASCLALEKVIGSMGQYFGGGNLVADGKSTASEVGKGIQKAGKVAAGAATVAATVYSGGAALAVKGAMGAAKAGKGIASGVRAISAAKNAAGGKLGFKNSLKAGAKGFRQGAGMKPTMKDLQGDKAAADAGVKGAVADYDAATDGMTEKDWEDYGAYNELRQEQRDIIKDADIEMKSQRAIMSSSTSTKKEKADAQKKYDAAKERSATAAKQLHDFKNSEEGQKYEKIDAAKRKIQETKESQDSVQDEINKKEQEKAEKNVRVRDSILTNVNAVKQYGMNTLTGLIPGGFKQMANDWNSAKEKGNSKSAEGKQALETLKDHKQKTQEERYDNNPLNKLLIGKNRNEQAQIISKAMIERAEFKASDLNDQMSKMVQQWEGLANKTNRSASDDRTMEYLEGQMRSLNKKVEFTDNRVINAHIDLDLGEFKKSMEEAIKKGATKDEINSIISAQLKKWGQEGNQEILKEVRKALEEIKAEIK